MRTTEVKIIEAATEAFTLGGVRGTSLGKVAEAAGVSRQTLYAYFGTKDDLLAAVIRQSVANMLEELEQSWSAHDTLSGKLDSFFELCILRPFEVLKVHPDLRDLLLGVGNKTALVAQQADLEKAQALERALAPFGAELAKVHSSPRDLGAYIAQVSKNLKYSSATRQDLELNLSLLKASVLALLAQAGAQ